MYAGYNFLLIQFSIQVNFRQSATGQLHGSASETLNDYRGTINITMVLYFSLFRTTFPLHFKWKTECRIFRSQWYTLWFDKV